MADEDRPVTGSSAEGLNRIIIGLPRKTKPVAGDFTIDVVDPQKPYRQIVFTGLNPKDIQPGEVEGSWIWPLKPGFTMEME